MGLVIIWQTLSGLGYTPDYEVGLNGRALLARNLSKVMVGLIFAVLGAVAAYRLWDVHTGLAILAVIATLYQASSLREMMKERRGLQADDKVQTLINIATTLVILGLLIYSFVE